MTNNLPPPGTLMKIQEVASHFRVAPMTIYRIVHQGGFPGAIRIERSIRIPVESVIEFERSQACAWDD